MLLSQLLSNSNRNIWINVGQLITGESLLPIDNAHILYNDQEIIFVGNNNQLPPRHLLTPGQFQPDANLPEYIMLPGLIEAHAHLFLEGGSYEFDARKSYLKQSPEKLLALAKNRLPKLIHLGITAVRDAGDKDNVGLSLSKLYKNGNRPLMPYLDSPGAAIHHQGRYGSFMSKPLENHPTPQDCVAERVSTGADRIKIIPTGIINFNAGKVTKEPQMTASEVHALVDAAKSFQRQTFAHASGEEGIANAIAGGVDSVEHGFFINVEQLKIMRDRQIAWIPTFAPVQKQVDLKEIMGWNDNVVDNLQRILDCHAESLLKAHQLGVIIIAGSDAGSYGVPHGMGFHYELELMEKAGLSPMAIINSATGISANRLKYHEPFGLIKPGHKSRFILTKNSPLDTITNLLLEKLVVFDGAVFDSNDLTDDSGL